MPPAGNVSGALSLWVADMDFACAEPIIKALHDRVDRLIFGYTAYDTEDLKNSVADWYLRRYEWNVPKENIFYCPGVIPAFSVLMNILTAEGDGIIIQPPVYHPFAMKIKANNRVVVNNPLINKSGYYEMNYEDLDRLLSMPENKGIIFCNPHNPVGRVWKEDEIRRLVELAKKYKKWIISDEIHADLVRKGIKFFPVSKIGADYDEEIITLTAPSKTFNLAGLKLSNIVINKKKYQEKFNDFAGAKIGITSPSPLAVAALLAAYEEGEQWLSELLDYLDDNVDYCMEFFKSQLPKSVPTYIEGTYLFWVDLRGYIQDPKELDRIIKEEAKVALNDGAMFGEEGAGFQRINLACPRSILKECLNRIKIALEKY